MNAINERKLTLIIKSITKTLVIDYSQNCTIANENSQHLHLNDIIFKATSDVKLFTPTRADILLNFLTRKLTRGVIIPKATQDLLLEFIEILEFLFRVKNTIIILTEQLFSNFTRNGK